MKFKYLSVLGLGLVLSLASCGGASNPTTQEPTFPAPAEGELTYKVTVLNENAKPLTGVSVQLCNETSCYRPVAVDANGVAMQNLKEDTYAVHLMNLPEIYAFDENAYKLTPANPELTINLELAGGSTEPTEGPSSSIDPTLPVPGKGELIYKVTVLDPEKNPLSGVKVQFYNDQVGFKPILVNDLGEATTVLKEDTYKIKLFDLPEIYSYNENDHIVTVDNPETTIIVSNKGDENQPNKVPLSGTGDKTDRYIVQLGIYEVTIKSKEDIVYFGFEALVPGVYCIESHAKGIDTFVGDYSANDHFIPDLPLETDDNSGVDNNFKKEFTITSELFYIPDGKTEREVGAKWTFGVSAQKEENYPVKFPVSFKLIKELEDVEEVVSKPVQVSETLSKYADVTGKQLTPIKMDGSIKTYYSTKDRFYHVGSMTGPVIQAMISKPSQFVDTSLTHIEDPGNNILLMDGGKNDYSDLIMTYGENCNSDGVYGMTKELKTFFTKLAAQKHFFSSGWITSAKVGYQIDSNSKWLFMAYTYEEA